MRLHQGMARAECKDIEAESSALNSHDSSSSSDDGDSARKTLNDHPELNFATDGLKRYWVKSNLTSMDGLPGLQTAYKSKVIFDKTVAERNWSQDEENKIGVSCLQSTIDKGRLSAFGLGNWLEPKVATAFILGVVVTASWGNLTEAIGSKLKL